MIKILLVIVLLLLPVQAMGQVLLSENWDAYTSEWSLQHENDGSGGYCPDDVFGFGPWAWCAAGSDSPSGDHSKIEITTAAAYGGSGRGFRINIDPASVCTTYENGLTTTTGVFASTYNLYLRWYFRLNFKHQTSYKKLFRIKDGGGTQRFILDLYEGGWFNGQTGLYDMNKTYFVLGTSADSFGNASVAYGWNLEDNYTPNTWICVEMFIDQTLDQWTLYIDGTAYGPYNLTAASNYALRGTMVGGNQCGNGYTGSPGSWVALGTDATLDYDNIVFSTSYVGPIGGADTTAPTISGGLPTTVQKCTTAPASVTLQATTDEAATCKYSTTDVAYASMANTFSTTGTTSHSQSLSLGCGLPYTYYLRCIDASDNANTSSTTVSFSVEKKTMFRR